MACNINTKESTKTTDSDMEERVHKLFGDTLPPGVALAPYGSVKAKLREGTWVAGLDLEILEDKARIQALLKRFNSTSQFEPEYQSVLRAMLGSVGQPGMLMPPFHCDYGYNIHIGDGGFINFNCTFLDVAEIRIGDNVMIGPNVQIYTVDHPIDPKLRLQMLQRGRPVIIEDNVWIGGSSVVLPNIRIGRGSVIGAGSVVTKDVPPNCVYVGNPARFLKHCSEEEETKPATEGEEDEEDEATP